MTKLCRVCEAQKSVEDFKRDRSRRDGRKSVCRECNRKIDAEYYSRTDYHRKRHLRRTYGLSASEWGRCSQRKTSVVPSALHQNLGTYMAGTQTTTTPLA